MATESGFWQDFRRWRRRRPFWGGLLLLIAGMELFFSANLSLGDMQVHIGPQGFLSYLLPLMLLLCGLLSWFTPAQRLFYGILGLLTALYSMIGLNFGGFVLGMLIGILGGALVIAWGPPKRTTAATAATEAPAAEAAEAGGDPPTEFLPGFDDTAAPEDAAPDKAAGDDRPVRPSVAAGDAPTEFLTRPEPAAEPAPAPHRKALVITLVPLVVTAAVLAAGSRTPARAETCPEGLPSRSTSASPTPGRTTAAPPDTKTRTSAPAVTAKKTVSPAASSGAPVTGGDDQQPGNGVLDGIRDGLTTIADGVQKLLGINGEEPAAPPAEPAPSVPVPVPSAPADGTPAPSAPAPSGPAQPTPPQPSAPSATASGSASASPTPSASDIPCLGPRVLNKVAGPDDVPVVSVQGSTLEGAKLTMYDSTYDGVSTLTTATGSVRALKFSMKKAVTEPFKLSIAEPGAHATLIKSNKLTIDGQVRFYTPKFEGKLFGVIPVTFTPEQPPPLTLPILWFTDVKINLAFIRCDTLKAEPLDLSEPR